MLKIDSNMTIKMSRGDDVRFPLFLDKGTALNPIRYEFIEGGPVVSAYPQSVKQVKVNKETWQGVIKVLGQYIFIYDSVNSTWKLNNVPVLLSTYGITLTMKYNTLTGQDEALAEGDTISIWETENDGCEVYFSIYHLNQTNQDPIFVKTFTSKNDLWKGKHGEEEPNGDMKIELLHTDPLVVQGKTLVDIPEGEYVYQIKAKVLDDFADQTGEEKVYVLNIVTNRLKLYIIDDDYSERLWGAN